MVFDMTLKDALRQILGGNGLYYGLRINAIDEI
jgi:hypothetical protein